MKSFPQGFIIVLLLSYCSHLSIGQDAGSMGLGTSGTTICSSNQWSVFNNPGGLGFVKKGTISSAFTVPFFIPQLKVMRFSAHIPLSIGVTAFGIEQEGQQGVSSTRLILAYGFGKEDYSFGGSLQLLQWDFGEYGQAIVPILDLGGMIRIIPDLDIGISFINPSLSYYTINGTKEYLPTTLRTGFRYRSSEWLTFLGEISKTIELPAFLKLALIISPIPAVNIFLGTSPARSEISTGIEFIGKKWIPGFGVRLHRDLGLSMNASISYSLGCNE